MEVRTPTAERPEIVDGDLTWPPDPAVPPLAVGVPLFFRMVWAE